ncbi:hypothetical protein FBU30_000398 [Linnemannia zychae]|nr:hypothetical protein FBU30_000398 [Linnemannia zychae]
MRMVIRHLTPFTTRNNPIDFTSIPAGRQRLDRFLKLYSALYQEDQEAMWSAYEAIRLVPDDLEYLSLEVWRMLVVYFKDVITPYHSRVTLAASPISRLEDASPNRYKIRQTWAARVVNVLNDKRTLAHHELSAWEYGDLMSAMNQMQRYEETLQEMDRVIASGIQPDPILLYYTVHALGGLGQLDRAVATIRDFVKRFEMKPSEPTLGYMIQEHILKGRISEARSFWTELTQGGKIQNIDTINKILKACLTVQESQFAQEVYDLIPRLGVDTNTESLNLMLSIAVAEISYPKERDQFLETMDAKIRTSDHVILNKNMLHSILVNFAKKGDAEGATLVLQLMRKHGFRPDTTEYNEILHCFTQKQELERAINWFYQMRIVGVRPDRLSYILLMRAYSQQRRPRQTEALFRQLIRDGINPDLAICNILLLTYEHAKMNRRLFQLYKNMFQDRTIGVDGFTFSCMFNAVFHLEKSTLQGDSGGGGGSGSAVYKDMEFQRKISEPIGRSQHDYSEQHSITLENESSQIIDHVTSLTEPSQDSLDSSRAHTLFQFEHAQSNTLSLDARSLFRDMVIVGIQPTLSLYANIIRAFLSQHDCIGTAVALRALVDHYALQQTPKITAIVVSWVVQEMERRGLSVKNDKDVLMKLTTQMQRARGLVEILESIAALDHNMNAENSTTTTASTNVEDKDSTTTTSSSSSVTKTAHKKNDLELDQNIDPFTAARIEMGGDLIDLSSRSPRAGSARAANSDNDDIHINLADFERWYRAYVNRTTYSQHVKSRSLTDHVDANTAPS